MVTCAPSGGVAGQPVMNSAPPPFHFLFCFFFPNQKFMQVLVFEDAPNGVESAKAAGMNVVMVPDRRTAPEKCLKADSVLKSLEELDLTEWGLPPL